MAFSRCGGNCSVGTTAAPIRPTRLSWAMSDPVGELASYALRTGAELSWILPRRFQLTVARHRQQLEATESGREATAGPVNRLSHASLPGGDEGVSPSPSTQAAIPAGICKSPRPTKSFQSSRISAVISRYSPRSHC